MVNSYDEVGKEGSYVERKRRSVWYLPRQWCGKIASGDQVIFYLSEYADTPYLSGCLIGSASVAGVHRVEDNQGRCRVDVVEWKERRSPVQLQFIRDMLEAFKGLTASQYAEMLRNEVIEVSERDYRTILEKTEPVSWLKDDDSAIR